MRQITLRFSGTCRKCGTTLPAGACAVYERRVGIFCPADAPSDPEEIRAYRQDSADRKAEKYEEWAKKRRDDSEAVLKRNEVFTKDIAFHTQPGHIPIRGRIIAQNDKAVESLQTARRFEAKAKDLRQVRVAGDAERARQAKRDAIRPVLRVGMAVHTALYGPGIVKRINKKTVTVEKTGHEGRMTVAVDLSWIRILPEERQS
jgi:hypothetical protein